MLYTIKHDYHTAHISFDAAESAPSSTKIANLLVKIRAQEFKSVTLRHRDECVSLRFVEPKFVTYDNPARKPVLLVDGGFTQHLPFMEDVAAIVNCR